MTDISSGNRPGERNLSTDTDPAGSNAGAVAKEQAGEVASSVADHAREVKADAAEHARDLMNDTRRELRAQAQDQSARVATLLGDLSGQMRSMADAGEPGPARDVVSQLADRSRSFADRLDDGGLDRILEDARRFAHERPGTFLAAAAATGFVAARLIRNADTHSLVEAAKPDSDTNGNDPLSFRPAEVAGGPVLDTAVPPAPVPPSPVPGATGLRTSPGGQP